MKTIDFGSVTTYVFDDGKKVTLTKDQITELTVELFKTQIDQASVIRTSQHTPVKFPSPGTFFKIATPEPLITYTDSTA